MKTRFLVQFALSALLFSACVPEDEAPRAYDEFIINETQFVSKGSKTYWSREGHFFWNSEDNGLFVNGVSHQLKDSAGCYYAKASSPTPNVNGHYYLAYYGNGSAHESLLFDETTCTYQTTFDPNSDWDGGVCNYVPLAACVTNNNVTLTPCCAVLRIQVGTSGHLEIYNAEGSTEGPFVKQGDINPVNAIFVNVNSYMETSYIELPQEGTFYVVLPMEHNQETIAGMKFSSDDGTVEIGTSAASITIRKGHIYDINLLGNNL